MGQMRAHTLGRRLVERLPEVRILGRTCQVKAEIVVLNGLSSHADHGDLLRSLGPLADAPRRVRLVLTDGPGARIVLPPSRPSASGNLRAGRSAAVIRPAPSAEAAKRASAHASAPASSADPIATSNVALGLARTQAAKAEASR